MSLHHLEKILNPTSLAVVGASEKEGSIGRALMQNLKAGGFSGPIYPINPKRDTIMGVRAFPSLAAVGQPIDLAVLATPIVQAPEVIRECSAAGVVGAIVIAGGGKETGDAGLEIEARIKEAAYRGGVRVVGPNCLGVVSAGAKLNASFAHIMPLPGRLAFVSQSGAICTAVLDYSVTKNIGFRYFISVGSMLDVDFGDLIDYLGNDPEVSSILLYMENVTKSRKFMSAARSVSRIKPIIVLKMGRYKAGARAAHSHTGAMAGDDVVYEAAFERAGIIRVETIDDLFGCAELVGKQPFPEGSRLAIITNAGGPGVMAADYLGTYGVEPASLSPATRSALDAILPPFWSRANPIDILGDASPELFGRVVETCMVSGDFDAVLVATCPQAVHHPTDIAQSLVRVLAGRSFPIFTVWMGGREMIPGRRVFDEAGIPTYDSPERAIRAFMYMYQHQRNLKISRQVPPKLSRTLDFDQAGARALVERAIGEGRNLLGEVEAKALLSSYGIPVTPTREAGDIDEAVRVAGEIGFPVALKLLSPDITHKSDAGGVRLKLRNEADVRQAYDEIMASARNYAPRAEIQGVTVQPMVLGNSLELILGCKRNRDFGPVILFGMGGVMAEVLGDRALGLPPLNRLLARRLMEGTKIFRILNGFRNLPPANLPLLEEILIRLSQLTVDLPEVSELDINPLLVTGYKALAVDARVVVGQPPVRSPYHLVISPYPDHYEYEATTKAGLKLRVRPIMPEDAPMMVELWHALSPRSVYHRFLTNLKSLSEEMLARHTQIDYDREMALVALHRVEGRERIVGVARMMEDPDGEEAELGISVGDPWQGLGVAATLLDLLLPIARERDVQRIWGQVFSENQAALALARQFGSEIIELDGGRICEYHLDLNRV